MQVAIERSYARLELSCDKNQFSGSILTIESSPLPHQQISSYGICTFEECQTK
jgi:hypothetical protein